MKRFLSIILFFCLFVVGYAFGSFESVLPVSEDVLRVHFFDIGQGDAALIETPNGMNILVDGGEGDNIRAPLSKALGFGSHNIDLMILSHPHSDHLEGFLSVMNRYDVSQIWYTGVVHTTPVFREWLDVIEKQSIPLVQLKESKTIEIDEGVIIEIIYPDQDIREKQKWVESFDGLNDTSVVFRLIYGNTSFLFTGDAERALENYIIDKGVDISADVIKIGHHGSKTSTNDRFLEKVSPKYSAISAGEGNEFGHPHRRTLRKLNDQEVLIYRTDIHGTIIFQSNGKEIKITTEK